MSYDTVNKLIQQIGEGAVMAKTDIQHAYKLIPIYPQDVQALGGSNIGYGTAHYRRVAGWDAPSLRLSWMPSNS